jgi:hypothetical protein
MSDDSLTRAVKDRIADLNSDDPAGTVEACEDLCAEEPADPPLFSKPFTKESITGWGPTLPPPPSVLFAAGYLLGIADSINTSVEDLIDNLDDHLPSDGGDEDEEDEEDEEGDDDGDDDEEHGEDDVDADGLDG